MRNDEGKLYRVSNFNYPEDSDQKEPDTYKYEDDDKIISIKIFTEKPLSTIFVACGEYLCWLNPEESCKVYYAKFEDFDAKGDLKSITEEIDLTDYIKSQSKDLRISSPPLSTILA